MTTEQPSHRMKPAVAVAGVAEKYKLPMVTHASTTSIFKKGRKFVFMVPRRHRPRGRLEKLGRGLP